MKLSSWKFTYNVWYVWKKIEHEKWNKWGTSDIQDMKNEMKEGNKFVLDGLKEHHDLNKVNGYKRNRGKNIFKN